LTLVLGLGCSSAASPEDAIAAASVALADAGLDARDVDLVATIDRLRAHPAPAALAARLGAPLDCSGAEELDAVEVPTPSAGVRRHVGTASVAEAAALLAAAGGRLLRPKRAAGTVTVAIAESPSGRLRPRPSAVHGGASPLPIDLSASLNPLGPSPLALEAARAARLDRYPEPDAGTLRSAAAARHGVAEAAVVPVPGAAFGLWLAMAALLSPGDHVVALGPCFGEYRRSAEIAGARFTEAPAWDLAGGPAMCVVANPGNPSGARIPAEELRRTCAAHPGTRFLVDEAFAPFAPPGTSLLDEGPLPPNALVVRSLTKELGLPGLRMGYLVAPPAPAARLAGALPAWPLSAPSIAAAVAGMDDADHVRRGAEVARRHVAALAEALRTRGLAPAPTDANYLLCEAPGLAAELAGRGIAVRDCASFGLQGSVRIAAPTVYGLRVVLAAIAGSSCPADT
jgi:histidinol-phosphate/aromatic aminotransferase/cobyric acid decarboxylase-like protein